MGQRSQGSWGGVIVTGPSAGGIADFDVEVNALSVALRDQGTAALLVTEVGPDDFSMLETRWAFERVREAVLAGEIPTYWSILPAAVSQGQRDCLVAAQERVGVGRASAIRAVKTASAGRALSRMLRERLSESMAGADGLDLAAKTSQEAAAIASPAASDLILGTSAWAAAAYARVEAMEAGRLPAWLPLGAGMERLERNLAIQPGSLNVLAAATGKGKTALALSWAFSIGVEARTPSLYLNSEMTAAELGIRLFSIGAGLSHSALRVGRPAGIARAARQASEICRDGALFVSEALGDSDPAALAALVTSHQLQHGTRVVFLDYVQRLSRWDVASRLQEWQSLNLAAKCFKTLATQRGLVVFLLAQLNGVGELAGAAGMAREADLVLHLEDLHDKSGEGPQPPVTATHALEVVKARHILSGGRIWLHMNPTTLRFAEINPTLFGGAR